MRDLEAEKLLAKFMGLKEDPDFKIVGEIIKLRELPIGEPMYLIHGVITNLRYYNSFDWLMGVVEKLCKDEFIKYHSFFDNTDFIIKTHHSLYVDYDRQGVYSNLCEFIKIIMK